MNMPENGTENPDWETHPARVFLVRTGLTMGVTRSTIRVGNGCLRTPPERRWEMGTYVLLTKLTPEVTKDLKNNL